MRYDDQNSNMSNTFMGAHASGGGATINNSPTHINANTTINITLNLSVTSVEAQQAGFFSKLFRKVIKNESTHSIQYGLGQTQSIDEILATVIQRGEVRQLEHR